jgi:hypothetical protein
MVAKHDKPLVLLDPYVSTDVEDYLAVQKQHVRLEVLKLIPLSSYLAYKVLDILIERFKQAVAKREVIKSIGISRRHFIKASLAGLSLVGLASIIQTLRHSMGFDLSVKDDALSGRVEKILGPLTYDFNDYRDVAVAEGLDILTSQERINKKEDQGSITAIYGAVHGPNIHYYVDHPSERALKLKSYLPYRKISDIRVERYEFDQTRGRFIKE